jgi:hypothetical protein
MLEDEIERKQKTIKKTHKNKQAESTQVNL